MNPVAANPLLGVGLHAIGALFASTCYTPQKGVKRWSWQSYWIVQASFCWFLLPIVGAYLTIPHLRTVLAEAPSEAMILSFLLGAAYGIGGTAFGLAIRYIGFSLTYAIAVGLSSVLGTLIPPLMRGNLVSCFSGAGGSWILSGVIIGTIGIAACGTAGRLKEIDIQSDEERKSFSLMKGLLISLLAGVLSAVYGFALEAGQPIADVAVKHGAGMWQGNVIYIFSNSGAFLTTALYCLHLHLKEKTFGELVSLPKGDGQASQLVNYAFAVLTGFFWYSQFFFYNLGHVRMGTYKFTSWAIHMIMLVLFSIVVGLVLREWKHSSPRTRGMLALALLLLVGAVLLLTYGNHLGEAPPA